MLPGILAGAVLAFARALGEFGATITFVGNIPGVTQTIPTAIYTYTQVPGGETAALRLTAIAIAIAFAALLASEALARRVSPGGCSGDDDPRRCRASGSANLRSTARFESEGRVTALFGRSGAGKTTLVNLIAGLIRPDSGRIVVDGETLVDTTRGIDVPAHRRRIGYVFQEGRLFPHLSVQVEPALRPPADAARKPMGLARGDGRPARHRPSPVAPAVGAFGRREAARRTRPGAACEPAPPPPRRAARRPRRGAEGGPPPLYRAPPRRDAAPDRLCQPFDRRGRPHRRHHGRARPTARPSPPARSATFSPAPTSAPIPGRRRRASCSPRPSPRATPERRDASSTIPRGGSRSRASSARRALAVRLRIRARDVAIAVGEPGRLSIRNRLAATVTRDRPRPAADGRGPARCRRRPGDREHHGRSGDCPRASVRACRSWP